MAGPLPPLTSTKQRLTNPGIPLYSEYRGGESDSVREVPPEWRAALDLHVTEQSVPTDQPLFELTDEIIASKLEQTFTSERKLRTTRKPAGVFTLLERFTNKDKEFGERTRTFHFIDDYPGVTVPSATKDVSTRNFGNKHFEEIVEEIPGIFDAEEFSVERPVVTPEDFRALLQEHEHAVTEEGTAVEPTLIAGDIKRTDTQQDLFLHRESRTYIDLADLPSQIVNRKTNRYKQIEGVVRTLELDSTTPNVPTALLDVEFTKLGDGTALEVVSGTAELFDQHVFARELPDVAPEWAKALLPILEESFLETDTAVDPDPLPAGVYLERQQQEDVFNRRVTRRSRDLVDLPVQRIGYRTNRYKQIETVTEILEDEGTTPAVPTALRDVTFELLGDGTAVEQQVTIDDVFDQKARTTEVLDLLPEIFKAALPIHVHEDVISGTSVTDPPVLATGDFFKSETRETEFTKKVVTRGRASLSLPQNVTAFRRIGGEQFGGEVTEMHGFLDDSEPSVETGLDIVSSKVTNLGNGTWFRETEKLDTAVAWPTNIGLVFDREMQVQNQFEEQVVDSSYAVAGPSPGDNFVETLKPLDQWHSKREKKYVSPSAIDAASALLSEVWEPFKFPGLVAASVFPTTLFAATFYRRATAQLCRHTVRTWWLNSATKPTSGPPGMGFDVVVEDIITGMAFTADPNNFSSLERVSDVLNDGQTIGTYSTPATTPTFTEYYLGTPSGTSTVLFAALYAPGASYVAGDTLSISGGGVSAAVTVDSVGISASILGYHTTSGTGSTPGLYGPFAAGGGSGSGALFYIEIVTVPTYTPGSAWITTERVIEASITPTDIPFLWKIVTKSVVMR
jgi:hypothetical protein